MNRACLICLMVLLLPWRAWAWSVMPTAPTTWRSGTVPVALVQTEPAPQPPAGHHPCHEGASAGHDPAPTLTTPPTTDEAQGSQPSTHTCTLCDICHAGLISPAFWRPPPNQAGDTTPPAWVPQGPGRPGACELYRPPRA